MVEWFQNLSGVQQAALVAAVLLFVYMTRGTWMAWVEKAAAKKEGTDSVVPGSEDGKTIEVNADIQAFLSAQYLIAYYLEGEHKCEEGEAAARACMAHLAHKPGEHN